MTGRLANTIFQGRSTDAMLVQDAYNVSTGETRNSLYDSVKGIYSGAVDGLFTNKSSARTLVDLIKTAKGGNVNKIDMLNRGLGAMGSSLPALLGTLGGTLKNKLSDAAGALIGDDASKTISLLYGKADLLIKVADVNDAESITRLISELAGDSELAKFVNIEAESAVVAGMARAALDFGLPDLVDEAIQQARTEQAVKNAYAYISSYAVAGSNLDIVNKSIDVIGLTAFLANNPDAIKNILGSYYFATDVDPTKYPDLRTKLMALLTRIDPHWNQYQRGAGYIYNLAPFVASSAAAKTLFSQAEPERSLVMAATGIQPQTSLAVMRTLYPNAYFSS